MRIVLDPWGGDYGSQTAVSHEVDSEDTSVKTLDEQIEEHPWMPVVLFGFFHYQFYGSQVN